MLLDLVPTPASDRTILFLAVGGLGLLVLWLASRARRNGRGDSR